MTATEILSELERRGVRLELAGDKLRYRPVAAVPTELLEAMRQRKAELLQVVRHSVAAVQARVRGQDTVAQSSQAEVCWHCHGTKACKCTLCAIPGAVPCSWEKGQCRACLGVGFLVWPVTLH